jgi:chemotaxis methyl-accepting protein methylase
MTNSRALETVVDQVAALLSQRIGLRPDPTMRGRLRRAVRDEASGQRCDIASYFDVLTTDRGVLQSLLNRVTIQETAFFRHPEHFAVLAADVLPTLPRPVQIWSAGCANGQEAFSLAMLLEEHGIDGSIIATDLSTAALERTATAHYTGRELSGLSPDRLARHLTRTADGFQVNESIRDRVRRMQHNVLDPLPTEVQSCQVVFCRNVLIYLSPEHARAFLDRMADTLGPTATLFLGAAEAAWPFSERFKAIPAGDTFLYRQPPARGLARTTEPVTRIGRSGPSRTRFPRTPRTPTTPTIARRSAALPEPAEPAAILARAGQEAIAAHDYAAAVVAFRKCAYLVPHDPLAQLHLGLALEAAGDASAAQRAYAAARRVLLDADPAHSVAGIEGYATAELIRLLDSKQEVLAR